MITLKAVRNDGKQPDIKGRDKNKPLRNSVPELAKSVTHSHFYQVRLHGTSVTEHHSSCSKSRDNLPEGESLARGTREPWPGPHLPLPQPPECSGSPGEMGLNTEPGAGGPGPGDSDPRCPDPQASILHFHKASPTAMVTQNHTSKNTANSFTKLG